MDGASIHPPDQENALSFYPSLLWHAHHQCHVICRTIKHLVDPDLIQHYIRVMISGVPAQFNKSTTKENTLLHWWMGNHPSIIENITRSSRTWTKSTGISRLSPYQPRWHDFALTYSFLHNTYLQSLAKVTTKSLTPLDGLHPHQYWSTWWHPWKNLHEQATNYHVSLAIVFRKYLSESGISTSPVPTWI